MSEEEKSRKEMPSFRVGDMVELKIKVIEGDAKRTQRFKGTVIRKKGSGISKTFTVRQIISGEGVEKIFPLASPSLEDIRVLRKGDVRRAKLYYLRERKGKKARL